MAHLDKLKITRRVLSRRPRAQRQDTVARRREKLINQLEEQMQLATAAVQGEPLTLQRLRGRTSKTVRPRLWWEVDEQGRAATQIYYNRRPLKLRRGGSTIEADSLKDLLAVYKTVIDAVAAGELDDAIAEAMTRSVRERW